MDYSLRIAIRQYITQPTDENAHRLVRLYLQSLGVPPPSDIPDKWNGTLTYAGLLREIIQLTDAQLATNVTAYISNNDEYFGMTGFHILKNTDVLDAGHPVIVYHSCRNCSAPLGKQEVRDHFAALENEGVGPPGHQVFGDVALGRAGLCQNCVYCVECSPVVHDPNFQHQCPLVAGCPCCDMTMSQN